MDIDVSQVPGFHHRIFTYDLSAASEDGQDVPLNQIDDEYLLAWEELDGSGFDVALKVSLYLK